MIRAVVVAVALLLTSAFATEYPFTAVDDLNRSVTLERAPLRIVTLIPSHTETVCALGACDLLVGRDTFSNFPLQVEGLPDLGSAFSADIERLVALEPDLVLADEFSGVAEALDGLGIPVFAGTPQTLDEVFETFELVGQLIDRETEAAVLVRSLRGEIDTIEALVAVLTAPTVYFELDATPYSVGPGAFIGSLIVTAGGANIVPAELGDFPQLDPEFVVASDPEVIVLADAVFGESSATVGDRPGWGGLAAVVGGRVIELSSDQVDLVNRPGPRIGEAIFLLAGFFHPGLF